MTDSRDITWQVVEGQTLPRSPTDPCGAKCSECSRDWCCSETDQNCQTPYALHRCPACQTPQLYMAPYWLHRRVVIRDRRSQGLYGIVAVQLGMTRQESSVELLAVQDFATASRQMVVRVGLSDIEAHFEPTPQKL